MVTYIAMVYAKEGEEARVQEYYEGLSEGLKEAPGFIDRKMMIERRGTMKDAVIRVHGGMPDGKHGGGGHGPEAVRFVMLEHWESEDDRIRYSDTVKEGRFTQLFPYILHDHSHEFYSEFSD